MGLQERYLKLTGEVMPKLASKHGWPIRFDHCFQRVVLDNVFQDEWYGHVDSPAYKNLSEKEMRKAVEISELLLENPSLMAKYNRNSLKFRGKI